MTGEQLYAEWVAARSDMAELEAQWLLLDDDERSAWDTAAEKVVAAVAGQVLEMSQSWYRACDRVLREKFGVA